MEKILTFGVFDYFHLGHLRLFKQCKKEADYLIVGIQQDEYVSRFKNNSKLLYSLDERIEILESLKIVDEVFSYKILDTEVLASVEFDILALGEDHVGERFDLLTKWCIYNGKKVVRLKRTEGISSTEIKEQISKDR